MEDLNEDKIIIRLLLESGIVTREQVKEVLKEHIKTSEDIKSIFLRKGYATQEDIFSVVAIKYGVRFVRLSDYDIEYYWIDRFPDHLIKEKKFIPLREVDGKLVIAFEPPLDFDLIKSIELFFNMKVEPVIATPEDIESKLKLIFSESEFSIDINKKLKGRDIRFVGRSKAIKEVLRLAIKVAKSDVTLLITGESGTGKEVLAELIHSISPRANNPLVKINCAAIPETLLEGELFGAEKGAYTGAIQRRIGKLESADKGTIFLDEIGEISTSIQVKLLRFIQTKSFERLGSTKTIHTDVRIIAATNRELKEDVKSGKFREDLFYRLNVVNIKIPPLRERKEDIPLLVSYFLRKFNKRERKEVVGFAPDIERCIYEYPWPGNVRELENCVERGVVLAEDKYIKEEDLPEDLRYFIKEKKAAKNILFDKNISSLNREKLEYEAIKKALFKYRGSIIKAAKELGMHRNTLTRKLKKYNIDAKEFR